MALHSTANEFFTLLSSVEESSRETFSVSSVQPDLSLFPPALETKIPTLEAWGKTAWSASKVDFQRNEAKNLVSLSFPFYLDRLS